MAPTLERFVTTPHGRIYLELEGDPRLEPVVSGPVSLWAVGPTGGEPARLETAVEPVFGFDWLTR